MAAIDFPASPTTGQIFTAGNGASYQWNGTLWLPIGTQSIYIGDTPPPSPVPSQLWWNSTLGMLSIYYNDGNSMQWVPTNPSVAIQQPTWRLLGRTVPSAGQLAIDFTNIAADINDLELRYDLTPAVNNGFLYLQMYGGTGTLLTTARYGTFADYNYDQMAAGATVTAYNGTSNANIVLNLFTAGWGVYSGTYIQGNVKVNNIRDTTKGKSFQCEAIQVNSANSYYAMLKGGGVQYDAGALTGLHLYFDNGAFAARGAASLWGSP
jgi:hypothetical protein